VYLTPTNSHWACDIEADNLLEEATRIWCVCVENVLSGEKASFTDAASFLAWQAGHPDTIYVGHNFIAYDAVMLNRFWGARITISKIVDTFVLSQLYSPTLAKPKGLVGKKGPHSLEAWGIRCRHPKTEHEDFSCLTPEMLEYCANDTTLTTLLFRRLSERMRQNAFTEAGVELEHLAWNIIQNKQRRNGFPFAYKRGMELYVTLRAREEELKNEIYKLWPPELLVVKEYRKAFKGDGQHNKQYERHVQQYPRTEVLADGSYRCFDYVAFNLGSPQQRIEKLLKLGWTPTALTPAGNPKVDEDALLDFAEQSGVPELKALAKWIVVNSRANMLFNVKKNGEEGGWLTAYNEKTGAIHGKLMIASTLRYRHNSPNSANIPAVRTKKDDEGVEHIQYGEDGAWSYECRDLWTCGDPKEWSLVGIDGTGIQTRCLIHHLISTVGEERVRDFKELALAGDIHKHNIEVLGLANKAAAKKFYYTLMMGGAGGRLAADQAQFGTKMTAKEGNILKEKMIASMPGFGELIKKLEKELERTGRICLCDGTPILVPSPHMVIPYILQGDESRLMKQALIYVDQEIRRHGLQEHVLKVADIHDEWQWRVRKQYVAQFIGLALPCFNRAGETFNYKIPIDGAAKEGLTWAETH
jgi:DNA polymerase-1